MNKHYLLFILVFLASFPKVSAQDCEWLSVGHGGSATNSHINYAVTVNDSDDIISAGYYSSILTIGNTTFTTSSANGIMIKYNSEGVIKWAKQPTLGNSTSSCTYTDIKTDAANNIYAAGAYTGNINFGNGVVLSNAATRVFVVKYNTNGVAQWARDIGNWTAMNIFLYMAFVQASFERPVVDVDNAGNVYLGANFEGTLRFNFNTLQVTAVNDIDLFVIKYTGSGQYISHKHIGTFSNDYLTDIAHDAQDNIYLTGNITIGGFAPWGSDTLTDNSFIAKMDSAMVPLKARSIESLSSYEAIYTAVRDNGEFVITGNFLIFNDFGGITLTPTVPGENYIAYYNSDFTAKWVKTETPASSAVQTTPVGGICIKNNYIYFGGYFLYSTAFGNSQLTYVPAAKNFYITKMDTLGNFLWAFGSGNTGGDSRVYGVAADNKGDAYAAGFFNSKVTIFTATDTGNAKANLFTAKIVDYSITRGYVSPGPYCAGDSIEIPYTKDGKFVPGNEFIAELSDSAGNFESGGIELGRRTDTAAGVIKGALPMFNVATNNKYRIRILSTKPGVQSFYRRDTLRLLIYSKDTANAGPDITICRGQSTRLQTTGGSKWNWWPPQGMVNKKDTANRSPLVKPDSSAEYRVIISDSSGCGVTDTDYVKIILRPDLEITAPDTVRFCKGRQATVTATAQGGNAGHYTFVWTYRDGVKDSVLSTTAQLITGPDSVRTYKVVLSDSCSKNDSAFVVIVPQSGLQLVTFADTTICSGNSVTIDARAQTCDTTAVKYIWDNGLGTGPVKTVSPGTTTTYKVVAYDTINNSSDSAEIKVTVRQPLQLALNNDTTICTGNSVKLKATGQGGTPSGYKVIWSVGSSPWADTNFIVTVSPVTTTTYTAILKDNCTIKPDTAKVVITVRNPLKITLNNDTTICVGESARLQATTSGGLPAQHAVSWSEVGGTWTDVNKITTVNPTATTTYKAALTDNCTVNGDSATIKVTVRLPLSVSINPDTTLCTGQTAQLKATPSGGLASDYIILWTADGGPWTDSNFTISVTPMATTTYKAVLTDNCTVKGDSATVTINVRPPLSVKVNENDSICQNHIVLLNAKLSGGDSLKHSLLWTVDRGPWTSSLPSVPDTPQVTSTYIATLTDNCSPPASDTVIITVLPSPRADFDFFPKQGCPPLSVDFTDLSYNHNATKNIWKIQNNEIFGVSDHTQLFSNTGTYDISLTVINTLNCSDNIIKKAAITVFEKPKAAFTVKPEIIEAEKEIYLINQSQRATTYTWDLNDGSIIKKDNLKDTTYSYKDTGNFTISLVAENAKGCKDTALQKVIIHDRLSCIIPNAFTPGNWDNLNSAFAPVCTGLKNYILTIYNRWGQVIFETENGGWDGSYEGETVPQGIYMYKLQIQAESGKKETLYGTVNVLR